MKIEIKETGISFELGNGREKVLILQDDNLDNDNFVTLILDGKEMDVALSELIPALIAFDTKRSRRLSEECND